MIREFLQRLSMRAFVWQAKLLGGVALSQRAEPEPEPAPEPPRHYVGHADCSGRFFTDDEGTVAYCSVMTPQPVQALPQTNAWLTSINVATYGNRFVGPVRWQ